VNNYDAKKIKNQKNKDQIEKKSEIVIEGLN
jgi:hypothetical protein